MPVKKEYYTPVKKDKILELENIHLTKTFDKLVLQKTPPLWIKELNKEYCLKYNLDYFTIDENENEWEKMYTIFTFFDYEYIIYLSSEMFFKDTSKDIERLISQGGDVEMIICRDETQYKKVNLDAIIFRNSEWSLYKLLQIKEGGDVLDQIYTDYNRETIAINKSILDQGIPYLLCNICVYNEHAFGSSKSSFIRKQNEDETIIDVYPWREVDSNLFYEIKDKNGDKLEEPTDNKKISKYIFQTMETSLISADMNEYSRGNLISLNPEYTYVYFDALDSRKFIRDNFPEYVYTAYNNLLAGAFKSDFWRYCVLYKYGGVYCDSQLHLFMPLNSFIKGDENIIIPKDSEHGLWNGFFCVSPKNPVLKLAIEKCCEHISQKKYSNDYSFGKWEGLSITGPKLVASCLNMFLNLPLNHIFPLGKQNINGIEVNILNQDFEERYIYFENIKLGQTKFIGYNNNILLLLSGKEKYGDMFNRKLIYKAPLFKTNFIHLIYIPWDKQGKLKPDLNDFNHNFYLKLKKREKDFQIIMWTYDKLKNLSENKSPGLWVWLWEKVSHPTQIVDFYRWFVVYHLGGIYWQYESRNHVPFKNFLPDEDKETKLFTENLLSTRQKQLSATMYKIRNGKEEEKIRISNQVFSSIPHAEFPLIVMKSSLDKLEKYKVEEDYDILFIGANALVSEVYDRYENKNTLTLIGLKEREKMVSYSSKGSWRRDKKLRWDNIIFSFFPF